MKTSLLIAAMRSIVEAPGFQHLKSNKDDFYKIDVQTLCRDFALGARYIWVVNLRIKRLDRGNQENLQSFIQQTVAPGSLVHSDGSGAYRKVQEHGFDHKITVHLGSDIPAHESMPGVHRVASLLQRWMMGTHHGAVQPSQLDYYLDEFVYGVSP